MAKRLTEIQIKEIINNFVNGNSIDQLSKKFICTKQTIIRNLKKNISENQYKSLIKNQKFKENNLKNLINSKDQEKQKEFNNKKSNIQSHSLSGQDNQNKSPKFYSDSVFMEIAPLDVDLNNETQKDLSSISIEEINFPKIVYMIVDNKIELEIKILKDYYQWQFLSQKELSRKTIEIYYDLKNAKRFCNKEQKVLKIPNPNVLRITAPILKSRGISRIVCQEQLIAL